MTTRLLLDTELMYLTEEDTSVATTVGAVDSTRLSTDRPVRPPRSHAFQRHYPGLFSSATTGGHILDIIRDRKSTRLNSTHVSISYAVFCLKKKKRIHT